MNVDRMEARAEQTRKVLDMWHGWMCNDDAELRQHWYPSKAAGTDMYQRNLSACESDADLCYEEAEMRAILACDAELLGLKARRLDLYSVVFTHYRLDTRIQFSAGDIGWMMGEAVQQIGLGLEQRGIVS